MALTQVGCCWLLSACFIQARRVGRGEQVQHREWNGVKCDRWGFSRSRLGRGGGGQRSRKLLKQVRKELLEIRLTIATEPRSG